MQTEKRTLTTAWNHQDQKKERVNVCIKIWQEKSSICFYLFNIPVLETGWKTIRWAIWLSRLDYSWQFTTFSLEGLQIRILFVTSLLLSQPVTIPWKPCLSLCHPSTHTFPFQQGVPPRFLSMFHQGQILLLSFTMFKISFPYLLHPPLKLPPFSPCKVHHHFKVHYTCRHVQTPHISTFSLHLWTVSTSFGYLCNPGAAM